MWDKTGQIEEEERMRRAEEGEEEQIRGDRGDGVKTLFVECYQNSFWEALFCFKSHKALFVSQTHSQMVAQANTYLKE